MLSESFFESLKVNADPIDETYVPRKTNDVVAKPPCNGCGDQDKCMREKLACRTFAVWMDSRVPKETHSKIPNSQIYKKIFGR